MKHALRAAPMAVLLVLAFAVASALAGPSAAAPYSGAAAVSVGRSEPCHGTSLPVSGTGYKPGSTVVVTIGGVEVGRATVDSSGTFAVTVTVPDSLRGAQTVTATGSSGGFVASTQITVGACSTSTGNSGAAGVSAVAGDPGGSGTAGVSTTGVAVLGLLVVAVGLVVGGFVLMLGGRRRSSRHAA